MGKQNITKTIPLDIRNFYVQMVVWHSAFNKVPKRVQIGQPPINLEEDITSFIHNPVRGIYVNYLSNEEIFPSPRYQVFRVGSAIGILDDKDPRSKGVRILSQSPRKVSMDSFILYVRSMDSQTTLRFRLGDFISTNHMYFYFVISGYPNKISLSLIYFLEDLPREIDVFHDMVRNVIEGSFG